jgi:hypothetical protein
MMKLDAHKTPARFDTPLAGMKPFAFVLPFVLSSCVAASGTGWYFGAIGTDAQGLNVSAAGVQVAQLNNSQALRTTLDAAQKMWRNYLIAEGLKFIAGHYFDHLGQEVAADKAIKLEELHHAQSEAEAAAKLQELKALSATTALP